MAFTPIIDYRRGTFQECFEGVKYVFQTRGLPTRTHRAEGTQDLGRDLQKKPVARPQVNPGYRQEVLNVVLAQLLQKRGAVSTPENILKVAGEQERTMPDVLVHYRGLRTVIEGEVDDHPGARESALSAAHRRVQQGIAHIGVGIVYPAHLRDVEFSELAERLAEAQLHVAIATEAGETDFAAGGVEQVEAALRHAFAELVEEDIVGKATDILDRAVESFSDVVIGKQGWVGRLADTLGIRPLPRRRPRSEDEPT